MSLRTQWTPVNSGVNNALKECTVNAWVNRMVANLLTSNLAMRRPTKGIYERRKWIN